MADTREHINDQMVEIMEELSRKSKSQSNNRVQTNEADNVVPFPPKTTPQNDVVNNQTNEKVSINEAIQKTQEPDNKKSLKNLMSAEHNLNALKKRLEQDPDKNKSQLEKLAKTEQKLQVSILNARRYEANLAVKALNQEPRRHVMVLAQSLKKIEDARVKLEQNPRFYKSQLDKLDKLESKINLKIESESSKMLDKAVRYVVKNPEKYRAEIDRYDKLKDQLKNIDKFNETEKTVNLNESRFKPQSKTQNLENDQEKAVQKVNINDQNKQNNQEKAVQKEAKPSRSEPELSR